MGHSRPTIDQLKREFSANPDDESLRGQLIIALRRAGRDSEALQFIQSQFRCPNQWDDLKALTPISDDPFPYVDPNVRHCEDCDKKVYFVYDAEALHRRAAKNQCIAAPQYVVDEYSDRILRPLGPSKERLPHCMNPVEGQLADFSLLRQFPRNCFQYDHRSIAMIRANDIDKTPVEHIVIITSSPISPETINGYLENTGATSHEIQFTSEKQMGLALNQRAQLFHDFNPGIFIGSTTIRAAIENSE
ncbi:MAG: BTAD domain-containing putative transcriptional regulator [Planctomycetota bacterium]|nr:BTAD domain-containing putative transcriptional regulator [Planctomycetota bacterium]